MKRKRKKKRNLYWTMDTEQAIVEYNICDDEFRREELFNKRIYKPLDKLAENIINRFKFPYMDGSFEDIKNEVVSYLVIKLPNFTADKGKSFSYFSVVAKNYCILQNNKRYKEEKKVLHLSDKSPESYSVQETLIIDPDEIYNEPERVEFTKLFIKYWDYNLHRIFPKKRDLGIAYAILELLKRAHMIQNFNKKAIYLMIREITDCETSHITKIVKQVKEIKDKQYEEYKNTGMIHDYFEN